MSLGIETMKSVENGARFKKFPYPEKLRGYIVTETSILGGTTCTDTTVYNCF